MGAFGARAERSNVVPLDPTEALVHRYFALRDDLEQYRERLRAARRDYAVIDRSVFSRLRSLARIVRGIFDRASTDPIVLDRGVYDVEVVAPADASTAPPSLYEIWLQRHISSAEGLEIQRDVQRYFPLRPVISILVPTYETPERYLAAALESVLAQTYPLWELCIADDASPGPAVREVLAAYAARDERVRYVVRPVNGHISAASNSALTLARGDFVGLLDHDDLLAPDALFEVVRALNQAPDTDLFYSDEDKVDEAGRRYDAFFKPDWSPETLLSRMYTSHLSVYRRALLEAIGGFREGFEGSQDYDLALRFTERTERIVHIPKVLYSWRVHGASTAQSSSAKPYAYVAAQRALSEALDRRGEPAEVQHAPGARGLYIPRFRLNGAVAVDIVIPSRDHPDELARCLESLERTIVDREVEAHLIVVDNRTIDARALALLDAAQRRAPATFTVVRDDEPFNFSRLVNRGVAAGRAPYVLLLNNDTEALEPGWLRAMVEQAQRPAIGAVGAKLTFADGSIQHAGIVLGLGGSAGHAHYAAPAGNFGYLGVLASLNNYSAVTAACLMIRREAYERLGGFDERFAVAFGDVDFCLRALDAGLRNVYLPHVRLLHDESRTRGDDRSAAAQRRFEGERSELLRRWGRLVHRDPYYNPNLSLTSPDFAVALDPVARWIPPPSEVVSDGAAYTPA